MGKKKVSLVSKVQLKEALTLQVSTRTGEAARVVNPRPLTQVLPVNSSSTRESPGGSGQLVQRKRRRLGEFSVVSLILIFI